jgi:hypothetical protein
MISYNKYNERRHRMRKSLLYWFRDEGAGRRLDDAEGRRFVT